MAKNIGKVREFCQSGKVGTLPGTPLGSAYDAPAFFLFTPINIHGTICLMSSQDISIYFC